jgi:hypothetical protein
VDRDKHKEHYLVLKFNTVTIFIRLAIICFLIAIIMSGCNPRAAESSITLHNDDTQTPVTYDGQIRYDHEKFVALTLTLFPQTATEGSFELVESLLDNDIVTETSELKGFYQLQSVGERTMLTLENTARITPLRRSFLLSNGKIREQNFRHRDLSFFLEPEYLQLVDNNAPVSIDRNDYFYKRTTPEFTVEGYMTYRGDTSYFYETNTKITWPLTQLGAYNQAAREYNALAGKKNDTTYLKATAYAIHAMQKSRNVDALVLKKIIQSSSLR